MARACDACNAAPCTLYCHTESTYLCNNCDGWIHAANSTASSHQRVWICTACENAPAAVTCKADAAYLCSKCDVEIHSVNALARRHYRVPVSPLPGVPYEPSSCYRDDDASGLDNTTINQEMDEDEAYSWLLLEPDSNEDNTNSGFTSRDDEYVNLGDICTEYQHQETYSQLPSSCICQEDSIVPDKSFETQQQGENQQEQTLYFNKEQEASESAFINKPSNNQNVRQQQGENQQEQTLYFNKEEEASKSVFINKPSNNQNVPVSFDAASMIPNPSGYSIPSSYPTFQNGTTDFFPNPPLLMPPQFNPMNREEKVLRYREKRKARKFEKKIRYATRKAYAETRPRVKGRFARKIDLAFDKNRLFSREVFGYGLVPSL